MGHGRIRYSVEMDGVQQESEHRPIRDGRGKFIGSAFEYHSSFSLELSRGRVLDAARTADFR